MVVTTDVRIGASGKVLISARMKGSATDGSTIVQMWCAPDEALLLARKIHDALEGREV